jgi:23S rRNA pseudouridine955/2504/2580 synthase
MSSVQHLEVRAEEAGWRFDRWVRARFPALGHGPLQKLLRTGQFRLDGRRVQAGERVGAGQMVRVPPLPDQAPRAATGRAPVRPEDAAFIKGLVVHEDESILVIDKPAGLAVQGGTGTTRHVDGMLDALARRGERPRLVHRLDRDTSGLLVLARTAKVAAELGFAFQQHRVRKLYWAILVKGPERNEGDIDLPLGKAGPAGQERMRPGAGAEARYARTGFRVLARAGKVAARTALLPLTGRTHQLRAHCAAIGAPIVGDGKYGGAAAHMTGAPRGLMLHARELELPRPAGRPLRLTAEPPPAFRQTLAWLGLGGAELPGADLSDWPPPR